MIKSSFGLTTCYLFYNSIKNYFSIKSNFVESKYYKFEDEQPILIQKLHPEEIDTLLDNYNKIIYDNVQSSIN